MFIDKDKAQYFKGKSKMPRKQRYKINGYYSLVVSQKSSRVVLTDTNEEVQIFYTDRTLIPSVYLKDPSDPTKEGIKVALAMLVATVVLGYKGKGVIQHKDGDPTNCHPTNLLIRD
jgi:hypothetical protein